MREVLLHMLRPGDAFTTPFGDYRLIYANTCRAYVEPLTKRRHVIKTAEGETAEFDAPGGRQNWSPETIVEPLENWSESRNFQGGIGSVGDELTRTKALVSTKIGRPPQRPKRQCDPATKRGRMLAIMMDSLTGDTPIADLMKEFSFTRSAVLTYCNEINRDYGVGYQLVGDSIRVSFPFETELFKNDATESQKTPRIHEKLEKAKPRKIPQNLKKLEKAKSKKR